MNTLSLTSKAFSNNDMIPAEFTCEGENINPPLSIKNIPNNTLSLAIVVEDPDIPVEVQKKMNIATYDHWVAFNIPPSTQEITKNQSVGTQGFNSSGDAGYTGPCPPAQYKPVEHRYIFTLYAVDITLDLSRGSSKDELSEAMKDHIIESTTLTGRYRLQEAV